MKQVGNKELHQSLKEAVAKKTNAKLDDSPLSYDVYSEAGRGAN